MSEASDFASSASRELRKDFLVVGMGGSAGAIPAFRDFFRNVPADSGMAYVVILHLSPDHESRLAEVLQGSSAIPVMQVRERVKVEPNHVYVIPPNQSLAMVDGSLVVSPILGFEQRRAPIDIFFRTLGEAHDSRAACVILSGSGSDGSMGLRRVKEHNGLVLVQDPTEAQFDEMPRHSIATGLVDMVLPVAEMPARIVAYRDQIREAPLQYDDGDENDEKALIELLTTLRVRTGHDFSNYKRATVLRRIERRMALHGLTRLAQYARFMAERPDEAELLLRELLISVTNFFRDPKVWETIEQRVIPELLKGKGADDHVRVWVAGCATGEEAYSVAMLLAEAAAKISSPPDIQIFATDLDEDAIARARNGCYSDADVADVSPERLRAHFVHEQENYRVRRELRELILFAHHNLIKDPPFSHIDFVSCRNVLIYLNRTAQERTMEVLHFALEPEGWLLLGTAESSDGSSQLFSIADKEAHLYQGRDVPRVISMPAPSRQLTISSALRTTQLPMERDEQRAVRFTALDLHHRLIEDYAPPSLILDDAQTIVHLSERAGRYLQFAAGEASLNVLQVIRPELRIPLRTALFQAAQTRTTIVFPVIDVHTGERSERVNLIVRPALHDGEPPAGYFLVLFEESREAASLEAAPALPPEPAGRQLEEELMRVKSQMRATSEQHEVQVEEARAANEELQAINEELRSTAEELETSQEELQSLNEELQTVNQELKVKIEEIGHTNDDLRNLMSSTEIGTIFVDRGLRVKLFTPRVRDLFNLIAADVGRPLLDINSKLASNTLGADLDAVLDRLQTIEHEVESREGRWYLMRLLPYRTAEDRIDGVVLTFLEVTTQHRAQEVLRETQQRQAYLLKLSDALRELADPAEIQATASRVLGEHLGTARAYYVDIDEASGEYVVTRDWHGPSEMSHAGRYPAGGWPMPWLSDGKTWSLTDVNTDPALPDDQRDVYRGNAIGAAVVVPLIKARKLVATFVTNQRRPRHWTAHEVALVEETAERTWAAVARARAEAALRRTEERYRAELETQVRARTAELKENRDLLQATMDSSMDMIQVFEAIRDEAGQIVDFRWILNNHTSERMYGEVSGQSLLQKNPGVVDDGIFDDFTRVIETGEPVQKEHHYIHEEFNGWFLQSVVKLDDRVATTTKDITDWKSSQEALQEQSRELAALSVQRQQLLERVVAATEEERRRIARELHDEMGQHLTALRVGLQMLQPRDDGGEQMKKIIDRLDESIDRLTFELRPAALDHLGLHGAITSLAEEFSAASGVRVDVHLPGVEGERFGDGIEIAIYRVLQEALTNISRHSGAKTVSVIVERDAGALRVIVEDDGHGFDGDGVLDSEATGKHFGLLGMRERLALLGGSMHIETAQGSGTTIYVRVPLNDAGAR